MAYCLNYFEESNSRVNFAASISTLCLATTRLSIGKIAGLLSQVAENHDLAAGGGLSGGYGMAVDFCRSRRRAADRIAG